MNSLIIGTWKLKSFELQKTNGQLEYPFGADAVGYVNYSPSGHFSVQYMPKEQSGEIRGISYFGRYEFNREKDYIVHHVEGSLFPSNEGLDKIRHARIRGKGLKLTCPPLVWGDDQEAVAIIQFEKQEELPTAGVAEPMIR
ncbi:lipocalin-like domain-containing protein [Gaoshiqia sediminis]|uniref:Lipocalin-like domain-containing protein n=1 Tax=Gaoshiqia sediminis TaxID=2986998 RepID=A0AA42C9R0_9BACT|nr:lipocalin-like domain-containing protein [Gaoshiqia sediminis]MCW0482792.1 lipocalin-like domain-containing protein [Gaoshiqia sediminis]